MAQSWIKAHDSSKNNFWENYPSIDSPITDNELNRNEVSVDTIDDRVITLDTIKAEQADLLLTFKAVSFDSTTGVFTFTKWNNTTVTVDTDIEKIAINFDYDDNPSSPHYQNLVIELEDGTYKYIDMSALITQYEFTNSSCISWTIGNDGSVTANVIDGSITESKLQPNFLADCRSAKAGAESAEANAIAKALVSEGYANGKQNGVPVTSESPYYHNNAEYFKDQASSIVGSKVDSFNGRTGVVTSQSGDYTQDQIGVPSTASVGQVPTVRNVGGSNVFVMETPQGVTRLQSLDMVGKTTTFNADGSISIVADDYSEDITFNANGSITEEVEINGVTTTKTTHFMGNDIIEDLHDYQGCVDLGSLTWTKYTGTEVDNLFYSSLVSNAPAVAQYGLSDVYCSKYETFVGSYMNIPDKAISFNNQSYSSSAGRFIIKDSAYTDANAFKTALSGVYATYKTSTQ